MLHSYGQDFSHVRSAKVAGSYTMPIYKNHQVNALAWAIGSPNLLLKDAGLPVHTNGFFTDALTASTGWLAELDDDPSPLLAALDKPGQWRVGLYFERLVGFWLEHHSTYSLACHEVQIRNQERTLGALDFVVETRPGYYEHWEIAVKFYLQARDSSEWSAWIGPNRRDRLDLKALRMISHQLPLSDHPRAKEQLLKLGIDSISGRRGLLKGMLFKHYGSNSADCESVNKDCPMGRWIEAHRLEEIISHYPDHRWFKRIKPDWLGERLVNAEESLSGDELLEHTRRTPPVGPSMWSGLHSSVDGWASSQRIFIVQDSWRPRG